MFSSPCKLIAGIALAGALGLAGCTPSGTTTNGITVSAEAQTAFAGKSPKEVFPAVSSKSFVQGFASVCERNVGRFDRALAQLKAQGYVQLAQTKEILAMAHPSGRPVFGFGGKNLSKPELCMVMSRDSKALEGSANGYVSRKTGAQAVPIRGLAPGARNAWITSAPSPRVYLTVRQNDAQLGQIFALAVGPL